MKKNAKIAMANETVTTLCLAKVMRLSSSVRTVNKSSTIIYKWTSYRVTTRPKFFALCRKVDQFPRHRDVVRVADRAAAACAVAIMPCARICEGWKIKYSPLCPPIRNLYANESTALL